MYESLKLLYTQDGVNEFQPNLIFCSEDFIVKERCDAQSLLPTKLYKETEKGEHEFWFGLGNDNTIQHYHNVPTLMICV